MGETGTINGRLYGKFSNGSCSTYTYIASVAIIDISAARTPGSRRAGTSGTRYQFERQGYFCVDSDSAPNKLVFNRTVTLKDTWAKIEQKAGGK